jgi:hypothetical protein
MGISDKKTIPEQKKIIRHFFDGAPIKKIAFLGSNKELTTSKFPNSVENYTSKLFQNRTIDCFDVLDNNWDINGSWEKIKGYDLVICFRTTQYAKSINHFFVELKRLVENNTFILFEFPIYSGNIILNDIRYMTYGQTTPRTPPLQSNSITFDFRDDLTLIQKIKAVLILKVGVGYFSGDIVNSFNRKFFDTFGIKINKYKYTFNRIKKDAHCYLYLTKKQ